MFRIWDSLASMVARLWPKITGVLILAGQDLSFNHNGQTGFGVHLAFYPMGTGVLSSGAKWLGHEADHSCSSRAKVKNMWNYTSTPTYLHGMVLS
jgi:hypothetical protein